MSFVMFVRLSICLPVRPSAHMEQHQMDFHEI